MTTSFRTYLSLWFSWR